MQTLYTGKFKDGATIGYFGIAQHLRTTKDKEDKDEKDRNTLVQDGHHNKTEHSMHRTVSVAVHHARSAGNHLRCDNLIFMYKLFGKTV